MHALTAQTAALFLGNGASHRPAPQTEAAYYVACVEAEARRQNREASQRWRARILAWLATRRFDQENRVGMARLLRSDPHLLRDMGIELSSYGHIVLPADETQNEDLMAPLPMPQGLPTIAPQAVVPAAPRPTKPASLAAFAAPVALA
jgi:hypothetical protein